MTLNIKMTQTSHGSIGSSQQPAADAWTIPKSIADNPQATRWNVQAAVGYIIFPNVASSQLLPVPDVLVFLKKAA